MHHDPNYAAALDTLATMPVITMGPYLVFVARVFDRSEKQVRADLLDWTEPAPVSPAMANACDQILSGAA